MSFDSAIKINSVGKFYKIYERPADRLWESISNVFRKWLGLKKNILHKEFWALNDISFEVKKGETLGIIGKNGSGKSTLLQIICGTLTPSTGQIQTNGRIAALLELGSGFNNEFTGRENIYLNAAILGINKAEIDQKIDEIIEFSGIGEFVDQPVKTYSSGMLVRLAFSVQAQVDPAILIIDEALAVGDVKFQARCFERLRKLKENGTTIILVTHSTEQIVSHCTRAVLINDGKLCELGEPKLVVNRYLDLLFGRETVNQSLNVSTQESPIAIQGFAPSILDLKNDVYNSKPGYNHHEYRWGDKQATILDYVIFSGNVKYPSSVSHLDRVKIVASIRFYSDITTPIFGIAIKTKEGLTVCGTNTEILHNENILNYGRAGATIIVETEFDAALVAGDYFISLGIASRSGEDVIPHDRRYDSIHLHVRPNNQFYGITNLKLSINVKN